MRVSTLILATATEGARLARQAGDEKRYSQLVDMMGHYNNEFDERKYWAYGCNCLILGKLFYFSSFASVLKYLVYISMVYIKYHLNSSKFK